MLEHVRFEWSREQQREIGAFSARNWAKFWTTFLNAARFSLTELHSKGNYIPVTLRRVRAGRPSEFLNRFGQSLKSGKRPVRTLRRRRDDSNVRTGGPNWPGGLAMG
jgi:hypothetical protein